MALDKVKVTCELFLRAHLIVGKRHIVRQLSIDLDARWTTGLLDFVGRLTN
jgi:hypothetical protein